MQKRNSIHLIKPKWVLGAAFAAVILAGCGGGGDGGGASAEARGLNQNSSDLVVFMKGLIAQDENGEVVDINPLTLVMDNSGDAAPL